MKLKYEKTKGQRVRWGYLGIDCELLSLWWNESRRVWEPLDAHPHDNRSSGTSWKMCKSPKAFVRLLKKWSRYVPPGTKFRLCSRWIGHDVTGTVPKVGDA